MCISPANIRDFTNIFNIFGEWPRIPSVCSTVQPSTLEVSAKKNTGEYALCESKMVMEDLQPSLCNDENQCHENYTDWVMHLLVCVCVRSKMWQGFLLGSQRAKESKPGHVLDVQASPSLLAYWDKLFTPLRRCSESCLCYSHLILLQLLGLLGGVKFDSTHSYILN